MNQEKIKKIIKVKDRDGNFNNWIIYGETKDSYKICAECDKRFITEIYKCAIDYINGDLYSGEIKNTFSLMDERYMRAEFCEIWARNGEC